MAALEFNVLLAIILAKLVGLVELLPLLDELHAHERAVGYHLRKLYFLSSGIPCLGFIGPR